MAVTTAAKGIQGGLKLVPYLFKTGNYKMNTATAPNNNQSCGMLNSFPLHILYRTNKKSMSKKLSFEL
jgi:hypothetical protein